MKPRVPRVSRLPQNTGPERELLGAILFGQVPYHHLLQPIVSVGDRAIHAYEVLSDWPREFGPQKESIFAVASRLDNAYELDRLSIQTILRRLHEVPPNAKVFLNSYLQNLGFLEHCYRETTPRCPIVIEIDFSHELVDIKEMLGQVERLSSMPGVEFAIDDIGKVPFDSDRLALLNPSYMKVDICVTQGIHRSKTQQRTLKQLLGFAERLGARTIVEGIEREEELRFLQKTSVTFGQGFLLSRPADYEAVVSASAIEKPRAA